MAARKPRKLVENKDFTHYLSIPIATRSSRPQLRASFARFERETAAIIPEGSVLNPDFARINLGRLNLRSKNRIDAFSKHLHGLDMHEMLRVAAVNAIDGPPKFSNLPYRGNAPCAFGVATKVDISPLKVDIFGIFSSVDNPSRTRVLRASAIDRTHRLQHFQHILLDSLFKADFLANAFHTTIGVVDTALPAAWGHKGTFDRETRKWSHPGRPKSHEADAVDLIKGWKNYDWATNIQLENLGVYVLGSREKLPGGGSREKHMTEVDSIALP